MQSCMTHDICENEREETGCSPTRWPNKMILEIILGHSSDQSSWLCGQHRLHNGNFTTATAASTVYASIAAFCKQWKYKSAQICMYLTFCDNSELWILSNNKKTWRRAAVPAKHPTNPGTWVATKTNDFLRHLRNLTRSQSSVDPLVNNRIAK